jgi:hypothetical protein
MFLRIAFALSLTLALLLLTLQFFLTPLYLEMEYDYAGFPAPPPPVTSDQRYFAAQAFLSYLNVEVGGATLESLGELRFDNAPFFDDADLACMLRAKSVRAGLFASTFGAGVLAIALGLVMAVDDFERARRTVILTAFAACVIYTGFSVIVQVGFARLAPQLLSQFAGSGCQPAAVRGLAQVFPSMIFYDGLVLLALFARFAAALVALLAWAFGFVARRYGHLGARHASPLRPS